MNVSNIFWLKNIVDEIYPNEDMPGTNIADVVEDVKNLLELLSDQDFKEIMVSCFIPDLYKGMGVREKLYTKLAELMVGEWWRRLGGTYHLPTKRSGTEDVELIYNNFSIVCDAKIFRLGRSQKAPNVKDFLKLASVELWISHLNESYTQDNINHSVIGGMVTYSSLHEWDGNSEVYQECTNTRCPVVMLPYELMALLLNHKNDFTINDFLPLWNYQENEVQSSASKEAYWRYVKGFICNLLQLTDSDYNTELVSIHQDVLIAVAEYRKIVESYIADLTEQLEQVIDSFDDINQLKVFAVNEIIRRDCSTAYDYLDRIDQFRTYDD